MIEVKLFAVVRERIGTASISVTLEELEEATLGGLLAHLVDLHPPLADLLPHVRIAVNHEFESDRTTRLEDGAEVALIPPVSGGSGPVETSDGWFVVTQSALDATAVTNLVRRHQAGAVITFEGTVRDHTDDHDVDFLEYDAYPEMALKKLVEVAEEAKKKWPAAIAIHHRWGRLELGDVAVVIAVSTPHRREAYECSQWVIDRLKEEVPIWKKEVGPDGSTWVGFGP